MTQEELKSLLVYDQFTGVFSWRVPASRRVKCGDVAGTKTAKGYIGIRVRRRFYLAHRLAWMYMFGCWPSEQIDHINRIRNDNRIDNLRDVSHVINSSNRTPASDFPGCFYDSARDAWQARIQRDGKKYFLGRHATKQKASEEYSAASSIWLEQQ